MKTMMMNQMQMRMCCCCCNSMRIIRNDKEEINQHIINIYKERQNYEKISIYDSIVFRAAS